MEYLTASINVNNRMTRNSYTTKQKLELLTAHKTFDGSLSEFCRNNDISRNTFRGWINKEHLITAHSSNRTKRKMYGKPGNFPDLDKNLSVWIDTTREKKRPIQYKHIREQVDALIGSLNNEEDYSQFSISDGWIKKFMERNNYSMRVVTHNSQENKKDQLTKANQIVDYLA